MSGTKDPSRPALAENIAELNYEYGAQMAREGYLTMTPDSRGFGELGGGEYGNRDSCNVHFMRGLLLGVNLLTLNVWDMMKCVGYLHSAAGGIGVGAYSVSAAREAAQRRLRPSAQRSPIHRSWDGQQWPAIVDQSWMPVDIRWREPVPGL